jgi:predicted deacylase/glutamine amidotransferase-like uncharacterized protein
VNVEAQLKQQRQFIHIEQMVYSFAKIFPLKMNELISIMRTSPFISAKKKPSRRFTSSFFAVVLFCALVFSLSSRAEVFTTNWLAAGTPFATASYIHDSEKPGPTLMLIGGVHGNEPAGAAAAEAILHWPLTSGKLVVIPRANVLALAAKKRLTPNLGTNLSNLNRNFPRVKQSEPPRGELAEAIWNFTIQSKPDWLIDLHEGYDFNQLNSKSVGSSVIFSRQKEAVAAADAMLEAVNATVTDANLKFARRGPPINGSLAAAAADHLRIPAMILETTSKQPLSKRVEQHELMMRTLLHRLGMFSEQKIVENNSGEKNKNAFRVAIFEGAGSGSSGISNVFKILNARPDMQVKIVKAEDIRAGALNHFDMVAFTGGSGSKQAATLGEEARNDVRAFVEKGGRYMGICAGSYLATSGYPWSLHIINAKTVSPKWYRGKPAMVDLELTEKGAEVFGKFGNTNLHTSVRYHNGPIVKPADAPELPPYEPLAYFRTEVVTNDVPVGLMINSPAIITGSFGKGHVLCISPHPEATEGLEYLISKAVDWLANDGQVVQNNPEKRKGG